MAFPEAILVELARVILAMGISAWNQQVLAGQHYFVYTHAESHGEKLADWNSLGVAYDELGQPSGPSLVIVRHCRSARIMQQAWHNWAWPIEFRPTPTGHCRLP